MSADTVGSLLADIANSLSDSLRVFSLADKTQWGPDEHEQRQRLAEALDEAKKDFQELSPLVHGQRYYMNDRRRKSFISRGCAAACEAPLGLLDAPLQRMCT